jgi:hypothetical protein
MSNRQREEDSVSSFPSPLLFPKLALLAELPRMSRRQRHATVDIAHSSSFRQGHFHLRLRVSQYQCIFNVLTVDENLER